MELKEYLQILQKNLGLVAITIILVTLFAYFFTLRQPITYEANSSLTIIPTRAIELKNVYEYGGYYDLQAATLFGNTIVSWLQSPDIVTEIYKRAGYEIGQTDSKTLAKFIKPTLSPNSFSVKFQLKDKDKNKAEKLVKTAINVIQDKTATYNQRVGTKTNFEIAASEPIIIETKPKKEFNTTVGALVGLILGIFLAFVFEYFRNPKIVS